MNINNLYLQDFQQRIYKQKLKAIEKQQQEISTGNRINSGSDDAAGLAISERLRAAVNANEVGKRNINDAKSMLETLDGGAGQIQNMVQRLRELAVRAQNGTLSTTDKQTIQNEANVILKQIDNTAQNTTFNNQNVLNNSDGLKFGSNASDAITVNLSNIWSTPPSNWTIHTVVNISGDLTNHQFYHPFAIGGGHNLTMYYNTASNSLNIKGDINNTHTDAIAIRNIQFNKDYDIVVTYDNSNLIVYSNGKKAFEQSITGLTNNTSPNLILGNTVTSGSTFNSFSGEVRQLSIFNDVVDPSQVDTNTQNLIGNWNLNESTGNVIKDSTGNNPDATFTGTNRWSNTGEEVNIDTGTTTDGTKIRKSNLTTEALGLSNLDISNGVALNAIDTALGEISQQRGNKGASLNRLGYSMDNVTTGQINEEDALKRIKNADITDSISQLSKEEIKMQTTLSMISKNNNNEETQLALLRG